MSKIISSNDGPYRVWQEFDNDGNVTHRGNLTVAGAVTGNLAGVVTPNSQVITAAGAVTPTVGYASVEGTFAITLAVPTVKGHVMVIEMVGAGGSVTLALTNVVGGSAATTCTWDAAGDTLILVSRSGKWVVVKELGVALT